jgi:putative membrane protein
VSAPDGDGARPWPSWVYAAGTAPDPRFSLANERTFLAWVRTSLALLAGGVGLLGAAVAWARWAAAERAMRLRQPLPGTAALAWLAVALMVVAAFLVVLVL